MKLDTINWEEEAQQFLEEHGNNDNHIHEWVDGLVPHYYYDIMIEANRNQVYHEKIKEHEVGTELWKVLQQHIYNSYYRKFMDAFFEALEDFDES